ncbi:putative HVA22-like protein g [Rhodamnia argentea]|uniref:HVA22-like protein n=1 Tax=Rhodamnia argentea TaxID=178133 RepID=A0A8B8QRV7_9MYRT|nr:putative HVA22-like protein g [Rhodamnia argentea]
MAYNDDVDLQFQFQVIFTIPSKYPAYNRFKTIENNELEAQQLLFRCQHRILVAFLSVCERLGDAFISWLPLYGEAKFAFFIYLWHPQTKGTQDIYNYFFRPYLAIHEKVIDRNLLELKVMAGDYPVSMWQKRDGYVLGFEATDAPLDLVSGKSTAVSRMLVSKRSATGAKGGGRWRKFESFADAGVEKERHRSKRRRMEEV